MRTVILYLLVIFAVRLMGKRQIGDLQPSELVITLLISEIAAVPLQDPSQPLLYGAVTIAVLVILEILLSVISLKSFYFRKLLSGQSVVIIQHGNVDQAAMRRVRMTVPDLIELLRGQDVFDLADVAFAVLETSGNLSVLKNSDQTGNQKIGLALPIISDGRVVSESLTALALREVDVEHRLQEQNLKIVDVFLMTMDCYGNVCVVPKTKEDAE
ncbi:MAG: DUF421 domain-containing protein [Clostridia bacterium]|nr:DUF421 domain-containing protein [Clostridia bacterium]